MAKRYSTAGISKNLTYTIAEIHEIRGTSPQTIRKYIRDEGLPVMRAQKPFLIHGADYIAFMESKRKKGKRKLRPGEFLCMTCDRQGRPFGDMADYYPEGCRPRLSGLCGGCEGPVSTYISKVRLLQYRDILDIARAVTL